MPYGLTADTADTDIFLKIFFQGTLPEDNAFPGAVIAIQSFGDLLGYNPHLHILCSDGCFYGDDMFRPALA